MGKKKKSFIDKSHSTTFRLVHRSQKDPLIADDSLGQHVFVPKNVEEQHKYGVYYSDDYDYLQHLKTVGETIEMGEVDRSIVRAPESSVQLPSTIFETQGVELKVGLLNQNAPDNELFPDVDPDIAAALDGEFEEEDLIDDDFMQMANAAPDDGQEMEVLRITDDTTAKRDILKQFGLGRQERFSDESSSEDGDGEDDSQAAAYMEDDKEERRTRFTNYSMSSAVIKRPDGLQTIDEQFETLYEQYDSEKLGEGDEEELGQIAGFIEQDSERMKQLIDEYPTQHGKFYPEKPSDEMKRAALTAYENEDDDNADEDMGEEDGREKKQKWDCESILSTYSNLYNHPTLIKESSSRKRKALLGKETLEKMDDSDNSSDGNTVMTGKSTSSIRPKGETAEERKIRKQAIRQERRDRRVEKKSNQFAFKKIKKEEDQQRLHSRVKARPIK